MLFHELDDVAKETAIEGDRDINLYDNEWAEPLLEQTKEDLAALGFEEAELWWSANSCKGDGACFDASCDSELLFWQYAQEVRLLAAGHVANFGGVDLMDRAQLAVLMHADQLAEIFSNEFHFTIEQNSFATHYNHSATRTATGEWYGSSLYDFKILDEIAEAFIVFVEDLRKDESDKLYRALVEQVDYLYSDDAVGETLGAIEKQFNVYGEEA
ncbi:MAG: hypothetical protein GY934_09780 [Gammaproteobacteria bacterium]|nr:hypothetical protein [Gammaproteobacteria bacterium]